MTTTNNGALEMTTGQTIAAQIGNRAFVMWGATNLLTGNGVLSFKVGRNAAKITHVTVTLNARDLYDVKFQNVRGYNVRDVSELSDVGVENLRDVIADATGMYASL